MKKIIFPIMLITLLASCSESIEDLSLIHI